MSRFHICIALTGLLLAGATARVAHAADKLKAMRTVPALSMAAPMVVEALDLGAKRGLEIETVGSGTSSTNIIAAVLGGEFEFGYTGGPPALEAIGKGADLVIVGAGLRIASTFVVSKALASAIPKDATVEQRFHALKGKTVATSPDGSANNIFIRALFKLYGMDPERDVNIVGLGDPNALLTGVSFGRFDAALYGSGVLEKAIADGTAELLFNINDHPMFKTTFGMVVVAKRSYAASHADIVSRFKQTFDEGLSRVNSEHDEVGRLLKQKFFPNLDSKTFAISWENAVASYPPTSTLSEEDYETFVRSQNLDPKSANLLYARAVAQARP